MSISTHQVQGISLSFAIVCLVFLGVWSATSISRYIQYGAIALEIGQIEEAIAWYNRAVTADPNNVVALRGMARAELAAGNSSAAVTHLEAAWRLQPNSLLVQQELAGAYAVNDQPEAARNMWIRNGLTGTAMLEAARQWEESGNLVQAIEWYQRALEQGGEITPEMAFRVAAAMARAGNRQPAVDFFEQAGMRYSAVVRSLSDAPLRIEAENLYTIVDGRPVEDRRDLFEPNIGFWLSNYPRVIMVDVPVAGEYELVLRAQHSAPAPVRLGIEINWQPIAAISLDRGDGNWEDITTRIDLPEGIHWIGLRFLNDALVDGQDRNAFVDWLELRRPETGSDAEE